MNSLINFFSNLESASLDTWAKKFFKATFIFLPLIFFPLYALPLDFTKQIFLIVFSASAFSCFLISLWFRPVWSLPRSNFWWVMALVLGVSVLSALRSENFQSSFFGLGFETDTVLVILSLLSLVIFPLALKLTKRDFINFSTTFILVAVITALGQWLLIILKLLFSWPWLLPGQTSGLVGTWYGQASYYGLAVLVTVALFLDYGHRLAWRGRLIFASSLILFLSLLFLMNYPLIWGLLALSLLALVILTWWKKAWTKWLLVPLIIFLLAGTLAIFASKPILAKPIFDLNQSLKINSFDSRPNLDSTAQVTKASLKAHPFLGFGPNRFWRAWTLYKPKLFNQSVIWSVDYRLAYGFIPTMLVTQGGLGFLAWLILIISSFIYLYHLFKQSSVEDFSTIILLSLSFIYLWLNLLILNPNFVILSLAFGCLGWLLVFNHKISNQLSWHIKLDTFLKSLVAKLGLSIILGFLFLIIILSLLNYSSLILFHRGLSSLDRGDFSATEKNWRLASRLSPQTVYNRSLADLKLRQINQLLTTPNSDSQKTLAEFSRFYGESIGFGLTARDQDPFDYLNWLILGQVYEAGIPLKIKGADIQARKIYQEVLRLNPVWPVIWLNLARVELGSDHPDLAREDLLKALELKADYSDALLALAELDYSQGRLSKALAGAKVAVLKEPNNLGAWFSLGFFQYQIGHYDEAVISLEKVLTFNQNSADTKYFLGLSLAELDRTTEAIDLFQSLVRANPDNQELKNILTNLKAGRTALAPPETKTKTK